MNPLDATECRARAALTRLVEPANAYLGELVQRHGAAAVLDAAEQGRLPSAAARANGKHADRLLREMQARLPSLDVDADIGAVAAAGGRLLCPGDDEWPAGLDALGYRAPLALWVRGTAQLAIAVEQAVAIVGTRNPSEYGTRIATTFGVELAERGWTIVSGGAYGIDAAAHQGALFADGTTVAVLACGVDVLYPRGHHSLFERVLADGAIVTELPPGCAPHRTRFLTRNRLIAAMAAGTVVVEAAARSGAKRTAAETRTLGRPLMAVPGPVMSATSVGCHQLLRDDEPAILVTNVGEVLELVGRIGADLAPVARGAALPRDALSPEVARVLDAVPVRQAQGPARIAATAGLPLDTVEAALGLLYLEGFVELRDAGWRLRRMPG